MNTRKKEIIIVTIFLILQTIIYIICGINKSYIHMDEAYSLGLASYNKTEIQNNEDFYNTWHTKDYYEDYLSVQEQEIGEYAQVYENQKNDVHPPLYYLLLRFAMGFRINHFSKWTGITINIILFIFITILMYFILQKLLQNQEKVKEKAILLAFLSSVTMASLTNAIYIRMYALATFNILLTTFLHMKLLECEKIQIKLLIPIALSVLVGVLTHYYYLFYLVMLYLVMAIHYSKKKQYKPLIYYSLSMVVAGILSLIIFPYSIKHMFFGYRGQGVINNLMDIPNFLTHIARYIYRMDEYVFHHLFAIIVIMIILAFIISKKKKSQKEKVNPFLKVMVLPTLSYFILVAVASPWIELRYIMPISNLLFLLAIYSLYCLLHRILEEKKANLVLAILLVSIFIAPLVFHIEPEVMYSDKKEIVKTLSQEKNVPTIYFFHSNNNRFLDDILLFATVDNSYVAKDVDCTEETVQAILKDKNIENGIVLFINEGQEHAPIIETVKKAMNFSHDEHIKRLNACDVYYLN